MNRSYPFNHYLNPKQIFRRCSFILTFAISILIWLSFSSIAYANPLPTQIWETEQVKVLLPDWNQTSFNDFPPIPNAGSVGDRSWQAGDKLNRILQLADISDLKPEIFSLAAIQQLVANTSDWQNIALSEFPLVGKQPLKHLVDIVPNLGQFPLAEVLPIAILTSQLSPDHPSLDKLPINQVLEQIPNLAETQLNQIDLSRFSISQIPNLTSVNLEQFSGWETERIADIPNLSQLPLSQFAVPVAEVGSSVMRIDMIYGASESKRQNTISGSDVEGFAVSCTKDCAYIELDDLENTGRRISGPLEGKQWISGKYQEVRGGSGCLAGWEPTGRHPFGKAFKVVVMEPDETVDQVDTALYFRLSLPCGKSPYIIGPIPFLTYSVNSPIFVGLLEGGSSRSVSRSTDATKSSTSNQPVSSNSNSNPTEPMRNQSECVRSSSYIGDVDTASLTEAIANLESANSGDYQAIGAYVCADQGTNCGMALGRYQLMSYREDVQQAIASVAGGTEFLQQVNNGKTPTSQELFRFFPPAVQDRLLQNSLAESINRTRSQVDPTTGQLFESDRLIERVAQKHFGGEGSKVDANYSDIYGGYSIKSYGEKVRQLYKHNTRGDCVSKSEGFGLALNTTSFKTASLISVLLGLISYFIQFLRLRQMRSFWVWVGLGISVTIGASIIVH